jgi:chromosome segregation ATPase
VISRPSPTQPAVTAGDLATLREKAGLLEGRLLSQDKDLAVLRAKLEELSQQGQSAREADRETGRALKELRDREAKLDSDLKGLEGKDGAAIKGLQDSLKSLDELQADLKGRRDSLEGIQDLMASLKKDLDDDSTELVDVKRDVAALKRDLNAPEPEGSWWDKAYRWPYLPAVALGVATVSLAVALSR